MRQEIAVKLEGRRFFIGGSDARIIMGTDEARLSGCGEKSGAKWSRRICPAISLSSLGL